jgi:hypothetical protein
MDSTSTNLFSIKWDETKLTTETIKWTLGANGTMKHEIVSPIRTKFELGHIVAHCLTVMHKIDACVGNHPANRFALYMNVFPRTLSLPHVVTWDTVLLDHPLAVQDVASFHQDIRQFIAVPTTDDVCLELLDYLHSIAMPPKRDVQKYFSCLCDNMWMKQDQNASRSVCNTACVDLFRFSRVQQKSANHSQKVNDMKQHIRNRTCSFCQSDQAVTRFFKKTKGYGRKIKVDAKLRSKKSKDEIKNSESLSEDTKGSIHPNSSKGANVMLTPPTRTRTRSAKASQKTTKLMARPHLLARMMYL